jgi:hypothetical protein
MDALSDGIRQDARNADAVTALLARAGYDIDAFHVRTRGSFEPVRDHHRCSA